MLPREYDCPGFYNDAREPRPAPFKSYWRLIVYDVLIVVAAFVDFVELIHAMHLAFFRHVEIPLVSWLETFAIIELDIFGLCVWVLVLIEHFRHRPHAIFDTLLLFFVPVFYAPIYYFRSLRPVLRRKLRRYRNWIQGGKTSPSVA